MNRNKNLMRRFNLQTFAGGTSIARTDAEALIPVQESHEIIQGVVEQSAVLQRGRRLANMTAAQYKMPVLDLLPVAYFVNGEGGSAMKQTTNMAWDKKVIYAEEIAVICLKDKGDAASVMNSLHDHVTQRQGTFEEYAPEQAGMTGRAIITRQDRYVTLIISNKNGLVQKAFESCFE